MFNYFFCKTTKDLIFAEIDENTIQFQEIVDSGQYILIKLDGKLDLSNKFYLDENNNVKSIDLQLEALKKEKTKLLNNDFNASKKITIQNGNTLIIKHNTPERNIFLDKLTNVLQESLSKDVSLSYQQQVDNVMYRFSALPIIWSYIFKDLFLVENKNTNGSLTGFKQNIREYNRITFEVISLKIQNTTTTEELNAISWEFANPNGIFINVNEKAEQMLNDPTVDDFTKSAINQSKDPETGQIHLINIVG